ncbi:hypothetical protein BLNAU_14741 [Blattamonas nauphoetae]|uniref:Uncharacterized protein n=1 Tax=Blattamonas nauphoetae TaxID=2049346 RepID=A0ABQ9XFY0_9EUKA|nr:hypothetical protein BLNAU_14741 [Blattamonas nauphoetae]
MSSLDLQSHHFSSLRLSCSIRRLSKRNHELSHSTVFPSKGALLDPSLDEILSQGKDHQIRIQNQSSSAARGWTDISPDLLADLQEGKAVGIYIHLYKPKYVQPTESTRNISTQFLSFLEEPVRPQNIPRDEGYNQFTRLSGSSDTRGRAGSDSRTLTTFGTEKSSKSGNSRLSSTPLSVASESGKTQRFGVIFIQLRLTSNLPKPSPSLHPLLTPKVAQSPHHAAFGDTPDAPLSATGNSRSSDPSTKTSLAVTLLFAESAPFASHLQFPSFPSTSLQPALDAPSSFFIPSVTPLAQSFSRISSLKPSLFSNPRSVLQRTVGVLPSDCWCTTTLISDENVESTISHSKHTSVDLQTNCSLSFLLDTLNFTIDDNSSDKAKFLLVTLHSPESSKTNECSSTHRDSTLTCNGCQIETDTKKPNKKFYLFL